MSIYVFHAGSGNNLNQLWYTVFDGGSQSFSQDTQIQNLLLSGDPAAVQWGGGISVFHEGWNSDVGPDQNLWVTYSPDGQNWDPDGPLSGLPQGAFVQPSPVVYNGSLYLFYFWGIGQGGDPDVPGPDTGGFPPPDALRQRPARLATGRASLRRALQSRQYSRQSDYSGNLYGLAYSVYAGGPSWNFVQGVPGPPAPGGQSNPIAPYILILPGYSPVPWGGGISVFHQGETDVMQDGTLSVIYSPDGMNWEPESQISNFGVSFSPSALIYNNNLYVFHQGYGNNGQLWYTYTSDGVNWVPDTQVMNVSMAGSPSAVAWEGGITVFHNGNGGSGDVGDSNLWYTYSPDGMSWGGDTQVMNVNLSGSPSAIVA
jgi:hypothetical protein